MGHEAAVTKKRVLGKVEQCVELVNETSSNVRGVQEAHNRLTAQTRTDVEALNTRVSGASALGFANEQEIKHLHSLHEAQVVAIGALAEKIGTLDRCVANRFQNTEGELLAFLTMTFWQRLWWVLTGYWPEPKETAQGTSEPTDPFEPVEQPTAVYVRASRA